MTNSKTPTIRQIITKASMFFINEHHSIWFTTIPDPTGAYFYTVYRYSTEQVVKSGIASMPAIQSLKTQYLFS